MRDGTHNRQSSQSSAYWLQTILVFCMRSRPGLVHRGTLVLISVPSTSKHFKYECECGAKFISRVNLDTYKKTGRLKSRLHVTWIADVFEEELLFKHLARSHGKFPLKGEYILWRRKKAETAVAGKIG